MERIAGARPSVEEAELLLGLSRQVTSTLDLQEVLDRSFTALHRLVEFGGGSIQLVDEGALVLAATEPSVTAEALGVRVPLGRGVGGEVVATGDPTYIPDITQDVRVYPEGHQKATSPGVRSWFGVPLILHGEPIGLIQIDSPDVDAFPPQARVLVLAFAPTIAAAVQNAQLYLQELQTLDRLREAETLKNDFLAVVSHELRTPLTSVIGFAETLAARYETLEPRVTGEIAGRILKASNRLARLIEDVLDIALMERRGLAVEFEEVAVDTVVSGAAEEAPELQRVLIDIGPDLPLVRADPHRIRQVVDNLLDNARKFSEPGSPISLRVWLDGDRVAVSVTDQGRGIPADMLGRVFDRFFQLERSITRSAGGLGIGLYLVKQLCDRMEAEVLVTSEVGTGSCFTVRLPLA